jgi:hypothetical protein
MWRGLAPLRARRAQSLYCAAESTDGAMRFAYCALLTLPMWQRLLDSRVRWLQDRPVKPGDDSNWRSSQCYACTRRRRFTTGPNVSNFAIAALSSSARALPRIGAVRSSALAATSSALMGLPGVPRTS